MTQLGKRKNQMVYSYIRGHSVKSMAVSGLSVVGHDKYGYFLSRVKFVQKIHRATNYVERWLLI